MIELLNGFSELLVPAIFFSLIGGLLAGIVIGAMPGLTSTMAVALFLPVTFGMEPVPGILLLISLYFGSIYGGSIAAILLNTPGTPASAATTLDGYPLTRKGEAGKALAVAAIASGCGSLISTIALILIAPELAQVALQFSAPESFALAFFGLAIISSVSGEDVVKGLIAGAFGLIIATVGLDPMTSFPRFTFGQGALLSGLNFIPVMIGLFAISEVFMQYKTRLDEKKPEMSSAISLPKIKETLSLWVTIIRSSIIGTFIGIIPGAGADIAAFVSYNEAKRFAKKKDKDSFGKGNIKGVAAAEAGSNGVTGGAMVPLLTLGIPGDAVAAVLLGAFIIQGIQPGPMLFQTNGDLVYALFAGMLVCAVLIIVFGLLGVKAFAQVLKVPIHWLLPVILILSVVGSYAISNNIFDVYIALAFGLIGYFMKKYGFPASPIVLALILGPMAESELRRSLVLSQGEFSIFFTRPIAATLISLGIISLFLPIISSIIKKRKKGRDTA